MSKKYDLHSHSTISDGTFSPKELIDLALNEGLSGISITDHDTIDAYSEDLFCYAREKRVELIPGVEFSSCFNDEGVHILGYFFDVYNQELKNFCIRHQERRRERNLSILNLLKKNGMELSLEDLRETSGVVGRPHIAFAMIKKGYVATFQDAFRFFIGDGKPCFVPGVRFSIEESIQVIHKAGGKAVLAHPILLKKKSMIKKLIQFPFDGVECFYANFSMKQNEEICSLIRNKSELVETGGSDFHGTIKPYIKLGSAYTSEENLGRLKNGV